jgi:hypothetical protein
MMTVALICCPGLTTHVLPSVFLYIGPDVFLPLTSALAAVTGFLLLFWGKVARTAVKLYRLVSRQGK